MTENIEQAHREKTTNEFIEYVMLIKEWASAEDVAVSGFAIGRLASSIQDLISTHYVKKDDVKTMLDGLKMTEMKQTKEEENSDWFYGYGYNCAVKELDQNIAKAKEGIK